MQTSRSYIVSGGVLTGAKGQQLAQNSQQAGRENLEAPVQKKNCTTMLSSCHQVGHIRTQRPSNRLSNI